MQNPLILNRYRPISDAGAGGYGTVKLAWDTRIQRRVAIKCMDLDEAHPFGTVDPNDPQQPIGYDAASLPGLDEARTAAMLTDPHIVGVYDFEVQDATAYLIMEYVDGMTLTQLLRTAGASIDASVVAAVFEGVAHALSFAHENQVLHLDIKPDNVIINRQGQVKVTDFGLARLSGAAGYGQATGGTIGYMPPEQMRLEPLDARCDEWALASLTYEMISGSNPFLAETLTQAQAVIANAELVLPSLCMEGIDDAADDVLFYALDPDREERYATVADFAEELLPCLGNAVQGRRALARLVGKACDDTEEAHPSAPQTQHARRKVFDGQSTALMRVWSVAGSGVMTFVALSHIDMVGGVYALPFWGLLALVIIAAACIPHLGALLASLSLAAALGLAGWYVPAGLTLVAAAAWWFFCGRRGMRQANASLSSTLFGAVGAGGIAPLICGYLLDVRDAAIGSAYAWGLALMLQMLGGNGMADHSATWLFSWNPLTCFGGPLHEGSLLLNMVLVPATWITLVSWVAAAALFSLCCKRSSRVLACIGALAAGVLLLAGAVLCTYVASGMTQWQPPVYACGLYGAATVVAAIAAAVHVPKREEAERAY